MDKQLAKQLKLKFDKHKEGMKKGALEIMNIKFVKKYFELSEKVLSIPKYDVDKSEKDYQQFKEFILKSSKPIDKSVKINSNDLDQRKRKIESILKNDLELIAQNPKKSKDQQSLKKNPELIHGVIGCNPEILSLMKDLKKEVLLLSEYSSNVKRWMNFKVPKISDGGNFGVGVLEEVITVLVRSEDIAYEVIESMTKYFIARGKLISKTFKNLPIEDYCRSLFSLDQSQKISLRTMFSDIRDNYGVLYDVIQKNIEKIIQPRFEHRSSMF
ncbi:proteasome regulator pa28 [Anaeramoeba flamelloides]|uniref:Proteasome regulator pa28 n=1 Tax=Anaeramoeba flamelloides TaxID=1746091 RepID=A0AAV8AAJ0_9EUKA|nr:proteasome regulator pa28 [Anaeramoeba flamelloides]